MEQQEICKVYLIKEWTTIVFGKAKIKRQNIWEVSNLGNVKKNGKLVYPNPNRNYLKIGGFDIHRAVAELFIPNPENKPCVDHIDGNPHNNRADNLRWVTYSENNLNEITKSRRFKSQHTQEYHDALLTRLEYFYWHTESGKIKREQSSIRMAHRNKSIA